MEKQEDGSNDSDDRDIPQLETSIRKKHGKCSFFYTTRFKLYCSRALSSWGDRMWSFAVGLYFIKLYPESLRLSAVYGFTASLAIIVCGAPIGSWIDKTARLKAARMSLIVQNGVVVLCATIVCLFLIFEENQVQALKGWFEVLCQMIVVVLAVITRLSSMATAICIEKDWTVVIAAGRKDKLTEINAAIRRIDLLSKLLAPLIVGQVMTISMVTAAIFLALWNIISVSVEYWLLWVIYQGCPQLALKRNKRQEKKDMDSEADEPTVVKSTSRRHCPSCIRYFRGWQTYFQQEVFPAGLGLALLYMTVLGFDSITVGYVYTQGLSEGMMGGMSGLTGLVGVLGTFCYPQLRNRIGLERTGLFGYFLEVICLIFCVASVWAPGSPFDPFFTGHPKERVSDLHDKLNLNHTQLIVFNSSGELSSVAIWETTTGQPENSSVIATVGTKLESSSHQEYTSVALLLTGIISARFGLWIADLTVNQIFQELVEETELGVVNGVQYSTNMTMDLLKFFLVIAIPWMETFGILVILSFIFVCSGWISYAVFSRKRRGHLFHFDLFSPCATQCASHPHFHHHPHPPFLFGMPLEAEAIKQPPELHHSNEMQETPSFEEIDLCDDHVHEVTTSTNKEGPLVRFSRFWTRKDVKNNNTQAQNGDPVNLPLHSSQDESSV
ncbi:ferroportin-like [Tachypleus tridentatus]|uniref:ferroportin-like n=1 Tax=Tachypleus tridentatus TaxID=6853 RepID=UPI003FD66003